MCVCCMHMNVQVPVLMGGPEHTRAVHWVSLLDPKADPCRWTDARDLPTSDSQY